MITDIDYYKTQIEQPLWIKCNKMISIIQIVDISKYLNYIIKDCTNFINVFEHDELVHCTRHTCC